jgi:hypothetical protein
MGLFNVASNLTRDSSVAITCFERCRYAQYRGIGMYELGKSHGDKEGSSTFSPLHEDKAQGFSQRF